MKRHQNSVRTALLIAGIAVAISSNVFSNSAHAVPVTTGLKLWLDATQGVTTSGGTATSWTDQSGNGHDGSYTSGAPQLVPAAINGLPAILFNGNGDYFSLAGGQVLSSANFTIFAVATDFGGNSGSGPREIYSNWDAGNSWSSVFLGTEEGDDANRSARLTDGLLANGAILDPTTPFIVSGTYTGGVEADLYVDGSLKGLNPQNSLPADSVNPIGQRDITTDSFIGQQGSFSGEYWNGFIGEVLIYDGFLTPQEKMAVYEYLAVKWIPEPGSIILAASGLMGLIVHGVRVRRRASDRKKRQ